MTERTGLSVDALRFYEREGLLPDTVERTSDGRRAYRESDVEWIVNCTRFRASGMPIATIRRFAELVRCGRGNERERLALLREHQQIVVDRIAELTESLALIVGKVETYESALESGTATDLWHDREAARPRDGTPADDSVPP